MEYNAPAFFKRGPSPAARFSLFALLTLFLLVSDLRYGYLQGLRQGVAAVLYPLQQLATMPFVAAERARDFFVTQSQLVNENAQLRRDRLERAPRALRLEALEGENRHLRSLLAARERSAGAGVAAEIVYSERNPFSRRIIVDKGAIQGIRAGQVVIDNDGVIGQVTRIYPLLAEVTLITDRDHPVPVQSVRNGLRAILFGSGGESGLEVRFLPSSADIVEGDLLVTSGIDGVYPPGLPVAVVARIHRDPGLTFATIQCQPLGGVERNRQVLILAAVAAPPEVPREEPGPAPKAGKKAR